jgi:hypothetical protein
VVAVVAVVAVVVVVAVVPVVGCRLLEAGHRDRQRSQIGFSCCRGALVPFL